MHYQNLQIISKDIYHDPFTNTQHRNQILKKNIHKQKDFTYPSSPTFPKTIYYVSH